MILVAGVAALIVVVLVGLALGLTSSRPSGGTALLAIGGGAFLVLCGGAVVVGVVGVGGGEDGESPNSRSVGTTRPVATTTSRSAPRADDVIAREVAVTAIPGDDFAPAPPVVDRLPRHAVLVVTATGFEPFSRGRIEQCSVSGCGNAFPIDFPESGIARVQFLVEADFSTSTGARLSCGPDEPPCVMRVSSAGATAFLTTVFGGVAPPPRTVTVDTPSGGLVDGQAVRVSVSGFVPGERVRATLCAAPAWSGTARCGAPAPVAPFVIDADGTGRTALVIRRGRVGTSGVACGRETPCGVVVASARSAVPGVVSPIRFAAGASVRYDAQKVVSGVLLAALLLLVAWLLARTTDWRKPTEADTPELDRAVL